MGKRYLDIKENSLESSVFNILHGIQEEKIEETNKNDKSDDGDGMDAVQPKAVKKKFANRKDKDIDNDGDVDSSDKYLHKRRKAVSKAITKKEGNAFGKALKDAKDKGEKTFVVSGKTYEVKEENYKTNEAYKPIKSNHYDVKIQGVKKKDVNAILKYIKVDGGNYDIEDIDADQVTGGGMSSTSDGDIFIQGDDAGKLGMEIANKFRNVKVMGEGLEADLDEAMGSMRPETGLKGNIITKLAIDMSQGGMSMPDVHKQMEILGKKKLPELKKLAKELQMKQLKLKKEEVDLDEGSWHIAKNMNALKKKMQKPIPKGDLMVKFVMKHIGDDELTDEMFDAKTGTDMVPMIKSAMKRLNIKEEVDLDEALTTKDWMKAVTAAGKKMGANMARKTPGKIIPFVSIDGDTTKVGYTDKEGEDHTIYTTKKKLPRAETDKMTADILKKFSEEVDEGAAADARRAISKDKDIGNRGRDSADSDAHGATDDDIKGASKNIIMQLRKAGNRASTGVEFDDKKKVKVDSKIAQAVQTKYNSLRRPAEKQEFQSKIAKSYKDLLKALKEDYLPIKETILDRIARKLMERKND